MNASVERKPKPYKGMAMEGMIATWYAKNTLSGIAEFRDLAKRIADGLQPGARVLEVAPGPGYLAIELARLGSYQITGLDVSQTFIRIARENAAHARVDIDFQEGDAATLPFAADQFDFIVCRAAFKNFSDPVGALRQMHRVLRPGGQAMVIDMRRDASTKSIAEEVARMPLGRLNAFLTRTILSALRRRAYSRLDFERMAQLTPFGQCLIAESPLGFEVTLIK
ncbi:MAG: class I SAM-dependent methyltransferase [Hyphomicrobiaceae bacterium]|nr:class I SAM-dependent methyltransferase [Hyphomicrobiaceae bacterium]